MKFNFALALPISVPLLFLSTLADAKLIKRGGASDDLGQITPYYIAPLDSGYWLGLGVAGPGVAEFIAFPELVQTDPVPFANRSGKVENRDSLDQCSPAPDVCEYEFLLGERLIVEGHSISFGLAEGVTTSFTWSLYEAKSKVVNNIYGAEIFTWEPTSINYAGVNGQIDVLLNTVFPMILRLDFIKSVSHLHILHLLHQAKWNLVIWMNSLRRRKTKIYTVGMHQVILLLLQSLVDTT
jgi:hypothetical protein